MNKKEFDISLLADEEGEFSETDEEMTYEQRERFGLYLALKEWERVKRK